MSQLLWNRRQTRSSARVKVYVLCVLCGIVAIVLLTRPWVAGQSRLLSLKSTCWLACSGSMLIKRREEDFEAYEEVTATSKSKANKRCVTVYFVCPKRYSDVMVTS